MTGCRQDMHDQAKYEPLETNPIFANDMASRPLVANTVPRGFLREDTAFFTGLGEGKEPLDAFPMKALRQRWVHGETMTDTEMNRALLLKGKKRFDTFCSPCHDTVGTGNGTIVQRGFKKPPSLHEDRLREALPGYFVNVITEGFGQMSSYAPQIVPEDRWAVAAYIRALQLSQNARLAELPPEVERNFRQALAAGSSSETSGDHGEASGHGGHASKSPDEESRSSELPASESANLAATDIEVGES
ncbi:MAG: cytochrome c [Deltaproteobacteria bacterium]|nr:cytochrome c [Deltaproteobacteria bacterium]